MIHHLLFLVGVIFTTLMTGRIVAMFNSGEGVFLVGQSTDNVSYPK